MASFIAKCALGVLVAMAFAVPISARSGQDAPAIHNPCIDDGDSCVTSAAICRLRGGSVLPLACSGTNVCCAL